MSVGPVRDEAQPVPVRPRSGGAIMLRIASVSLAVVLTLGGPSLAASGAETELLLAEKIDQILEARLRAAGVEPAPLADDAEYLRRVYLDLVGRIPSIE